jgi:hypothetical protein
LRRLAGLATAVALLAGCGSSGPSANDILKRTASSLSTIKSGTLDLKLLVTSPGKQGTRFGFTLHGPFQLGKTPLPVLHVAYTQIAGDKQATATLISDGQRAVAVSGGKTLPLSESARQTLSSAAQQIQGAAGLGAFDISSWIEHPKVSGGGEVGAADTNKVTADLNVLNATNSLLALMRLAGRDVHELAGADAKQLEKSVKSSSFVLYSGKRDRLLRKVDVTATFGFDVPKQLANALGTVGAKVEFELGVANPNKPVSVKLP